MKIHPLSILFIFLFVCSCEKEDMDYRLNYVGKYDFEIVKNSTTYVGDASSGHIVSTSKHSTYSGTVKIFLPLSNMIKVDWGTETINVENGKVDQSKTIFTVDREGNLECPEAQDGLSGSAFIHGDTIRFNFYGGGGMAHMLGTTRHVTGLKK